MLGRRSGPSRARRRLAGRERLVTPCTGAWTPGQTPGPYACLANMPGKAAERGWMHPRAFSHTSPQTDAAGR